MQRLIEMRVSSGGENAAQDAGGNGREAGKATLLALVAACEPLAASAERQAHVLVRVLRQRAPRRWLARAILRPAFAGAVLLLAGLTTAAATVAPRMQRWGWLSPETPPAPLKLMVPAARALPVHAAAPPAESARLLPEVPVRAGRQHARAAGDNPARIVAAVRALRSDDDPARAQRLALEYLRAYPRGALAEEALAVAIEASARQRDPQAARLAGQYLRAYPNGRFHHVAEQALGRGR